MFIKLEQTTSIIQLLIIITLGTIILSSCDKNGYKNFTETDDSGVVINGGDPTDWALDTEWEDGIDELIASGCTSEGLGETTSVTVNPHFPILLQM